MLKIIRYVAPVVTFVVRRPDGEIQRDYEIEGQYDFAKITRRIGFEKPTSGRYRTSQLQPDSSVTFTIQVDGFQPIVEKVDPLLEGEERVIEVQLPPIAEEESS